MDLDVMERFERVLADAKKFDPDAYFFTGDFCASEPKEWVFEWLAPRLAQLGKPYYLIPGNHDDRSMMRRHLDLPGKGDEPILQAMELKGESFLFLDTRYGEFDQAQLVWLEHHLNTKPGSHVIMHHPPIKLGQPFMDNNFFLKNPERLQSILREAHSPVHVFCGHYHSARTVHDDNIFVHLCPPTSFYIKPNAEVFEQDFLPPGYHQITWTKNYRVRVTPVYLAESPLVAAE